MRRRAGCYNGESMTVVDVMRTKAAPSGGVRSITILGATGSIGASTLDLIKREPERYRVEAVSCAPQRRGARQDRARGWRAPSRWLPIMPPIVNSKTRLSGSGIEAAAGEDALVEAAQRPADWVMAAISGAVGLKPTLAAVERGATVALANKECLVCAGGLFMRSAAEAGATVLPVDSEHNAVFQALGSGNRERRQARDPDGIGRTVPNLVAGSNQRRDA